MKYQTHPLYFASHIVLGMIAYFYPILIVFIIGYQLLQLALHKRFFVFSWKIEEGNSVSYTCYKLMQYAMGYMIAYVIAYVITYMIV
jgi:hypothetical protein